MGQYTARFTEINRPDQNLYPEDRQGVQQTNWYSMRDYHRAVCFIQVGTIQPGGTIDANLQQATDGVGGGPAKAIAGKAITQLTQAGGDSRTLVAIELQTEELDVDNGFDNIRVNLNIVGASAEVAVLVLRLEPRFAAVDTSNLQEVVA